MSTPPHLFFNRAGEPIEHPEWIRLVNDEEYRLVGCDTVGRTEVRTVWTGAAMPDPAGGPDTIFETIVHGDFGAFKLRYASEAAAVAGHAATLRGEQKRAKARSQLADLRGWLDGLEAKMEAGTITPAEFHVELDRVVGSRGRLTH